MFPQLLPLSLLYPPAPLKLNHLKTFMNHFKVLKALNHLNRTCYFDKICRQKYERPDLEGKLTLDDDRNNGLPLAESN